MFMLASGRARHRGNGLDAILTLKTGGSSRRVHLADYLDADAEERAAADANRWIKTLRLARVDGVSFRERFTYQGDSLWWFAELYLHKERAIVSLFRAVYATAALIDREGPQAIDITEGTRTARVVVPQAAAARGVQCSGANRLIPDASLVRMDARSTALMLAAVASPQRPSRQPSEGPTRIAAFVHSAFWRREASDGSAESYIGPVLEALEERVPPGMLRYVGVGPATNFRARRWWRRETPADAIRPVEMLVPRAVLAGSSGIWAARHAMRRSLQRSRDLREAAEIDGCDCWPIVSEALAGIALLQWPWSARAMDEAGAALDALSPDVALTYAEAGGWGRALALECRRRGIPLAGLQHGFIYRHWLNYLHTPDEVEPAAAGSRDRGFPFPDLTLLFDEYAATHLKTAGHFPPDRLAVTGSPRLDQLAKSVRRLNRLDEDAARSAAGVRPMQAAVLLVTKYSEVKSTLGALLDAVRGMPDTHLVIKPHPAETPEPYELAAAGIPNVSVMQASAPLAPLIRMSRALVTVNSTVALDGLALGVPALSIGLPNNLSPFVAAGAIAGAASPADIGPTLRRLLYDQEFRDQLSARAGALAAEWRMLPDGGAAERSADAVLRLVARQAERREALTGDGPPRE